MCRKSKAYTYPIQLFHFYEACRFYFWFFDIAWKNTWMSVFNNCKVLSYIPTDKVRLNWKGHDNTNCKVPITYLYFLRICQVKEGEIDIMIHF